MLRHPRPQPFSSPGPLGLGLVSDEHIDEFASLWSDYEPDGTKPIHVRQFAELVTRLSVPLGQRATDAPVPPPTLVAERVQWEGPTQASGTLGTLDPTVTEHWVNFQQGLRMLLQKAFGKELRVDSPAGQLPTLVWAQAVHELSVEPSPSQPH